MPFYIRKSLKVDPFRFNLSKSGVGVSAGVKGARIGTGPRGNYIHLGSHGLYYRSTLPSSSNSSNTPVPSLQPVPSPIIPEMQEIESGSVSSMVDSSSADLLTEINTKRKKMKIWPLVFWSFIALLLLMASNAAPGWLLLTILVTSIAGTIFVYNKDQLNKTVILFYDFEPPLEEAYQNFYETFEALDSVVTSVKR